MTDGTVYISVQSRKQLDTLKNAINPQSFEVMEKPPLQPQLTIHGIDFGSEIDEVNEAIQSLTGEKPFHSRFTVYRTASGGTKQTAKKAIITVTPKQWRFLVCQEKINIGWSKCNVEKYISVRRCMQCGLLGYTSKFCSNTQHFDKFSNHCENCTIVNSRNTLNPQHCVLLDTRHGIYDCKCPTLQQHLRLTELKTDYISP